MGCGGPSSVYLSTLSLGGATRIEYRPWEVESVLFVVTYGVLSAVREGHGAWQTVQSIIPHEQLAIPLNRSFKFPLLRF